MSNFDSSFRNDAEALIDLLEDIVASYQDNDSRPAIALSLYRQRVHLEASARIKPAKRFVIIKGGARRRPAHQCTRLRLGQPRLRLLVTPGSPVEAP